MTYQVTPDDLAEIRAAASSAPITEMLQDVDRSQRADLRRELRQKLVLELLAHGKAVSRGWLNLRARSRLSNYFRQEAVLKATEASYAAGIQKRYRDSANWEPTWYPPHPDAREHDWLACAGARVMHSNPTPLHKNNVEHATIACIDAKRR